MNATDITLVVAACSAAVVAILHALRKCRSKCCDNELEVEPDQDDH